VLGPKQKGARLFKKCGVRPGKLQKGPKSEAAKVEYMRDRKATTRSGAQDETRKQNPAERRWQEQEWKRKSKKGRYRRTAAPQKEKKGTHRGIGTSRNK